MFETTTFDGDPIDAAYVAQRSRNEPLTEVTQTKGTSETHPALSPNDEWADFEIMPYRVSTNLLSEPPGSYVRDAYRRGLTLGATAAGNPYRFGLIGSSDTHVSAGAFSEEDFWGASGLMQTAPEQRGSVPVATEAAAEFTDDGSGRAFTPGTAITSGASGLTAVWAEENTREAIFAAMRRKETFATTGPRIRVRMFAGFDLEELDVNSPTLVEEAYARGTPMGGVLSANEEPVRLLAWAARDEAGGALQRLQVVKGWLEDGTTHERVYDVACADGLSVDPTSGRCPDNGANVDLRTCEPTPGKGAGELKTIWTDPEHDPEQPAFYYVRVLENPSCRWSTWDAVRAGTAPRRDFPPTIQERAFSFADLVFTLTNQEGHVSKNWQFVHDREEDAEWHGGLRKIFDYRDLGVKAATGGDYIAHVIRANGRTDPDAVSEWHVHDCNFQLVQVLRGWATFEYEGEGRHTIRAGDCVLQPPGIKHREIEVSPDFEVLEIVSPANFATRTVDPP